MRFWKRLRWSATLVFVALVALSWLGTERAGPWGTGGHRAPRIAPNFHQ
jgi:hypothetical protein